MAQDKTITIPLTKEEWEDVFVGLKEAAYSSLGAAEGTPKMHPDVAERFRVSADRYNNLAKRIRDTIEIVIDAENPNH